MASTKAIDPGICNVVGGDAFSLSSPRLRRPLCHCKRFADARKCLPICGCTDQRVHQINGTSLTCSSGGEGTERNCDDEFGHPHEPSSFTSNTNRASYLAVRETL